MGYVKKEESKPRVLPPEGNHIARCYMVVDFGHQEWEWNGEQKDGDRVYIQFELPKKKHVFDEKKGPEPFVIGQEFTISYSDKSNLYKFLDPWLPKGWDSKVRTYGFDFEQLVGMPARLKIVHNESKGKVYANIQSIMGLDEDEADLCPPLINQSVYMWMAPEAFNIRDWLNCYQWMQEKAKKSPDWQKLERLGLTDTDAAYRRPVERDENEARPTVRDSVPDRGDVNLRKLAQNLPKEEDEVEYDENGEEKIPF